MDKENENPPQGSGTPGPVEDMVSMSTFKGLEAKVNDGFSAIMNKLEGMSGISATVPPGSLPQPQKLEAGPDDETPIPPAWKKLVVEILGEDFSCELNLPASGGTIFKVIVPREKSNASQMHWTMFKRDIRSKELGNTGEKGVKEWCLKVRKNLLNSGMKLPVYP